ncbi:hypothetical protein Pla123a_41870 [Posidoniimonas polymericola]|uniref:Uncharacterized protein n=1 Tax=Posidoniimonas polymericola TaxID=2528002 RepID=A0A5C5XYL2_9BACT|nr:hypothetical protein Pla123a_41870 [Posidoniimonas polymericola]
MLNSPSTIRFVAARSITACVVTLGVCSQAAAQGDALSVGKPSWMSPRAPNARPSVPPLGSQAPSFGGLTLDVPNVKPPNWSQPNYQKEWRLLPDFNHPIGPHPYPTPPATTPGGRDSGGGSLSPLPGSKKWWNGRKPGDLQRFNPGRSPLDPRIPTPEAPELQQAKP